MIFAGVGLCCGWIFLVDCSVWGLFGCGVVLSWDVFCCGFVLCMFGLSVGRFVLLIRLLALVLDVPWFFFGFFCFFCWLAVYFARVGVWVFAVGVGV